MSEEDLHSSGWTQAQVTAWQKGTWTPEKLLALEIKESEHIDNCEDCQDRLLVDPRTLPDGEPYYCSIGESLRDAYSQASVEYSWQPDFDPKWWKK